MRGWDATSVLFSYVNCERRVPQDRPLRAILGIVDEALAALSPEFEGAVRQVWSAVDPAGAIAPRPAVASVLFGPFREELMEQLEYNLLFRWFVGLSLDDEIRASSLFRVGGITRIYSNR